MTAEAAVVALQLGRPPRGLRQVAHYCPCGLPDVVETAPRLADGTPFPTLYYLTCPRAVAAISRLEAAGVMRQMQERLASDAALRDAYQAAHRDYLARRDEAARAAGVAPLPSGTQSAGGMPGRVKCLHALAAHELAVPGANPLGRETLAAAGPWWAPGPCVGEADAPPEARPASKDRLPTREAGTPQAPGRTPHKAPPAPLRCPGAEDTLPEAREAPRGRPPAREAES